VRRSNANPEGFRDSDIIRLNADITRSFGPVSVKLTPYGRDVYTRVLLHFFPSKAIETTGQAGGGIQSALYWDPNEKFSGIVGVDYDHTRGFLREVQTLPNLPGNYVQGLHYDYVVNADVVAAYAHARYTFLPEWSLTAGLRQEHTRYDYNNNAPSNDFGRYRRAADRTDEFDALTPKLGVLKQFSSGGSAYFNYARGARAPQTADLYELQTLQTPGNQPTQTIDSFELGLRKPVLGGRFEVSIYSMNKQHESLRNASGVTVNNAKTRHQGVEVSATMPVGKYFSVMGWATYAEHTYRYADPSAIAGEAIIAGNEIDTAPRRLANLRAQWKPVEKFSSELEWEHVGRYFTNAANTRVYPGHDVLNLRADWSVNDRISLFGAVRNLTNLKYAERADYVVIANVGTDRYFPAEDRAFSIGVRATR
jgi:outer membrane receptor protein involved in Fe transport